MKPTTLLIDIVLLAGPQCGHTLTVMREAQALEVVSGNAEDPLLHEYLATDEADCHGNPVFRYSGKTRDRHEDPTI